MSVERPYSPDDVRFPPTPLTPEQQHFAHRIKPVCEAQDLFLTSYFRSPEKNDRVGGARGSLHLEGLAVDLDKFGADLDGYEALAADFNALNLAVLIYFDAQRSYMHVQSRPLLSGRLLSIVT